MYWKHARIATFHHWGITLKTQIPKLYGQIPKAAEIKRTQSYKGYLPLVRINRLGWPLNSCKRFAKISKPTERDGAYLQSIFRNCFRLMRDWKLKNGANAKEISALTFWMEMKTTSEELYNFRTDFLENYCSIWLSTESFRFFGYMVSTQKHEGIRGLRKFLAHEACWWILSMRRNHALKQFPFKQKLGTEVIGMESFWKYEKWFLATSHSMRNSNFNTQRETAFPKFPILIYGYNSYRKFPFPLIFLPEISEFSLEWLAFRKFINFRIDFSVTFPENFQMSDGTEISRKRFSTIWVNPAKLSSFFPKIPEEITVIETGIFGRIGSTPLSPPEIPGIKLNGTEIPSKKFPNIWVSLARLSPAGNTG